MKLFAYILRKCFAAVPLMIGVTLLSFILMVYFGPDKTYELIGKHASPERIAEVRETLGYNKSFFVRYFEYLHEIVTFNWGQSLSTYQNVSDMFKASFPITAAVALPGYIFGNLLALLVGLLAANFRGEWEDRVIMGLSVVGMSISLLIVVIVLQIILCSSYGLNLFPIIGYDQSSFLSYLKYITVPTLSTIFVAMGYNTRFYRAIFVEETTRDHIRTARAFGCPRYRLFTKHVFKNSLIPIITRMIFTLPFTLIGGSLIIESYFSIPGLGLVTFNAITSGDLPVLKAVVAITALAYIFVLTITDILYRMVDPRIEIS